MGARASAFVAASLGCVIMMAASGEKRGAGAGGRAAGHRYGRAEYSRRGGGRDQGPGDQGRI